MDRKKEMSSEHAMTKQLDAHYQSGIAPELMKGLTLQFPAADLQRRVLAGRMMAGKLSCKTVFDLGISTHCISRFSDSDRQLSNENPN